MQPTVTSIYCIVDLLGELRPIQPQRTDPEQARTL
jgi:hypothetical protein